MKFTGFKAWLFKWRLRSKIDKLRIKNPTWYGDVRYNEALDECIKLIDSVEE